MTTITRSLPISTSSTSSTTTTTAPTVVSTPRLLTTRDEFISGDTAQLRAKVLGLFQSPSTNIGLDLPGPGDLIDAGKKALETGKDALESGKDLVEDGLDALPHSLPDVLGLRERAGDLFLDKALGVDAERVDSLQVGDSINIGADLEIEARLNGGIGGGVTLTRTADGEYTAKVGADLLAGFDLKAFGLSSESAWGAEFKFSSPEDALEGLQGILKSGGGIAGLATATSDELSLLKDNLSAVQFSSTAAAELASQAGLDLSLEGGVKYGARVEFDDGVPSDLVFTLGQQWEGSGAVDVLPALDKAAEAAAGASISGEHSAKAQVGVELRYELPGLVGDSYVDKLQNLLDGEVTLPKLPTVSIQGEATAQSGGEGGLAKAKVTLSPSGVPAFLKNLSNGDLTKAAQSLARVTAEAWTFKDEEHFTDKGVAFGFGTAEFTNSTRHLERHATFDSSH